MGLAGGYPKTRSALLLKVQIVCVIVRDCVQSCVIVRDCVQSCVMSSVVVCNVLHSSCVIVGG